MIITYNLIVHVAYRSRAHVFLPTQDHCLRRALLSFAFLLDDTFVFFLRFRFANRDEKFSKASRKIVSLFYTERIKFFFLRMLT